jgi:hypothetical protein
MAALDLAFRLIIGWNTPVPASMDRSGTVPGSGGGPDGSTILILCLAVVLTFATIAVAALLRPARGRVQALLLIHRDGRLFRDLSPGRLPVDPVIFSGMVIALEAFVSDSVADRPGSLEELRFGDRAFVLERGRSLLAVAIWQGVAPRCLRESLRACIAEVESADPGRFARWDGSDRPLPAPTEARIAHIVSSRPLLPDVRPAWPAPGAQVTSLR